jgi:alpha-galactosidase
MEFGLWVEPEMVNPDSDLTRSARARIPRSTRPPPPEQLSTVVLGVDQRAVVVPLFGRFGLEWDIACAGDEERAGTAEAIALYKRHRALLASGEVVRVDHPDPAAFVHGVVAADRGEALFAYVQRTTSAFERPGLVRLDGLDPEGDYRVEPIAVAGGPRTIEREPPP